MVARTAKFMGVAYSTGTTATIEVEYNNTVVFSGTVPAITQDPLPGSGANLRSELFSFTTDTDITGQIPMKISVIDGQICFKHIDMNYCGNYKVEGDPSDPNKTIVPVLPADFYGDPNITTMETDGITNGMKNSVPWDWRVNVSDQLGNWAYPVMAGEIFTFDFFVDPTLIVIDTYVPPN